MEDSTLVAMGIMTAVILIFAGIIFIVTNSEGFNKAQENVFSKSAVTLLDVNSGSQGNFHTYIKLDTFIRKGSESHTRMVGKVSSTYYTYYIYVGSDKTGSAIFRFENNEQKLNETLHISGYLSKDTVYVNKIAEK